MPCFPNPVFLCEFNGGSELLLLGILTFGKITNEIYAILNKRLKGGSFLRRRKLL